MREEDVEQSTYPSLAFFLDRDDSAEKQEERPEEFVEEDIEEDKEEPSTYPELVDRAEQLQEKLNIWRDIFAVHKRFPNRERWQLQPEQSQVDNSVSEDQTIIRGNPRPNANPSIMALMN